MAGPCARVGEHPRGIDDARHGEAELQLGIGQRVAAQKDRPRLLDRRESSSEDLAELVLGDPLPRETADVQAGDGPPPHGVDVAQGVGGGDPSEIERIVDDRRDEVEGLHEGEPVGETEHSRVVRSVETDEHVRIGARVRRESVRDLPEVRRTHLGRSTAGRREVCQSNLVIGRHGALLLAAKVASRGTDPCRVPARDFASRPSSSERL